MRIYEQNREFKEKIKEIGEAYNDLERYLCSSKFQFDTTVQVKDVLSRMENIKSTLAELNYIGFTKEIV